jgi:hypothetical protein
MAGLRVATRGLSMVGLEALCDGDMLASARKEFLAFRRRAAARRRR